MERHLLRTQTTWRRTARVMRVAAVLLGFLCLASPARAAVLVDDATLVGSDASPASRAFPIAQTGRYELQLTDVGLPVPLASLQAAVTRGNERIAVLNAPGVVQFDATAGEYEVQVAGIGSGAAGLGSFSARVVAAPAGAIVLDYADTVAAPPVAPPAGQTTLQTQVTIASAGSYRITLADLGFPEALTGVDVLLTRGGVQAARISLANPSADFLAVAGTYDLLAVAQAGAATAAGLYGVSISDLASGTRIYDQTQPVGRLGAPVAVMLPSTAQYTMALADLDFPVALASTAAALVRGANLLAQQTTEGSVTFNASSGGATLYALPTGAAPAAVGAMAVDLRQGASHVLYQLFVVSPPPTSSETTVVEAEFTSSSPGSHRVTLTDFDFPAPLGEIELGVYQAGQELGRRSGAGPLDVQAAAGPANILVAATPGASGSGLYGVQFVRTPAGIVEFETTQAVGAIFEQRTVDVTAAGSYDLSLTDLQFPAAFGDLAAAVTRGTERVGFVFGSGTVPLAATSGTYFINLITRVDPTARFGTYGLLMENSPPAPTVTLAASPTSVKSGQSATLTWSSADATSCVASGQWTGGKPLAGTQAVGPLSVESTFTLSCSGAGGSSSRSVVVAVRSSGSGGGGGATETGLLALLLGVAALRLRGRNLRRSSAAGSS